MTLKEVWENKRLTPTQVAAKAGISVPTLYKMSRKVRIAQRNVLRVCEVLSISKEDYEALDASA